VVAVAVTADDQLVAVPVTAVHVTVRRPGEPEHDPVHVVGRDDGEDPLGPLADLPLTAQRHFGG